MITPITDKQAQNFFLIQNTFQALLTLYQLS
jgi:hypothetical protein